MPNSPHHLDNPVHYALLGPHAGFAEGEGLALRYSPAVSAFGGLPDEATPEAWEDAHRLVQDGSFIVARHDVEVPEGWRVDYRGVGRQMIAESVASGESERAVPLGGEHVEAMVDLVERTKPGPFAPRTFELGNYFGIFLEGRLAAMGGNRMRVDGYREVSAVCADPAFSGQGLGMEIVRHVVTATRNDGDEAMLHVSAANPRAQALYERMGFVVRTELTFCAMAAL